MRAGGREALGMSAVAPMALDLAPPVPTRRASRLASPAGRRFMWAAVAAAVLSAVFVAWTGLQVGGERVTVGIDDIGEAIAALLAAASCGYMAATRTGRFRLAWALIALS